MSWSGPTFLDNLKTALDANVTLAALSPTVQTFTCWTTPDVSVTDCIMLYAVRGSQENITFRGSGPKQNDQFTVEGEIRLIRTLEAGSSTETINKAARDRAKTILDQLVYEAAQRPDAGDQNLRSRVSRVELDQLPATIGSPGVGARLVLIGFDIEVTARTSLS
jgi:hypothetical protein